MSGFTTNIETKSLENTNFRQVLFTTPLTQLVVMSLLPGEDIGLEAHDDRDQFIRVEAGEGRAVLNGVDHELSDGMAVVVPAGTGHNVINTSDTDPLKLYTIYSPPEHADGTVHRTREEAMADEAEHHKH